MSINGSARCMIASLDGVSRGDRRQHRAGSTRVQRASEVSRESGKTAANELIEYFLRCPFSRRDDRGHRAGQSPYKSGDNRLGRFPKLPAMKFDKHDLLR